jgi:DNA mismatch repair protein MutL
MRHPYFHRAIQSAFERLIPSDKQVSYFYCLDVDPSKIDVNIHPTKTEIKFEDEQAIWQILLAVTRETLGTFNAVPVMDFEKSATPAIPTYNPDVTLSPRIDVDKSYNPFQSHQDNRTRVNTANWQKLYDVMPRTDVRPQTSDADIIANQESSEQIINCEQNENTFLQYGRYIITQARSGLMLIDQHRAHVRILYDKFIDDIQNETGISQGLLFPELFQLSPSQIVIIKRIMPDLHAVGFDISDLGGGSYAINGVPAGVEKKKPVEMVMQLLEKYNEKGSAKEVVRSSIALNLAKSNALTGSQILSNEEMAHIVSQLLQSNTPKYTPDGKVIVVILGEDKISALLK